MLLKSLLIYPFIIKGILILKRHMQSDQWEPFTFSTGSPKKSVKNVRISEPFSPEKFQKTKATGQFRQSNQYQTLLQGYFEEGQPSGKWTYYDDDGDKRIYEVKSYRIGAICKDGTKTALTGRGAGSGHKGVQEWEYETKKRFIGGTGKYDESEVRLEDARKQAIKILKLGKVKNPNEVDYKIYTSVIELKKKLNEVEKKQKKQEKATNINESDFKKIIQENVHLSKRISQLEFENDLEAQTHQEKFDKMEKKIKKLQSELKSLKEKFKESQVEKNKPIQIKVKEDQEDQRILSALQLDQDTMSTKTMPKKTKRSEREKIGTSDMKKRKKKDEQREIANEEDEY